MAEQEAVTNRDGNVWLVEHSESAHLTHVGGFLLTFHDLSCIVISARWQRSHCGRYYAAAARATLFPFSAVSAQRREKPYYNISR